MSDPFVLPVPQNAALLDPTSRTLGDIQACLSSNPNFSHLIRHGLDTYAVFSSPPTDTEVSGANDVIGATPMTVATPASISPSLPDNPTFDELVVAVKELLARG